MQTLCKQSAEDVRFKECMNACVDYGTRTAICVTDSAQSKNDEEIRRLHRNNAAIVVKVCAIMSRIYIYENFNLRVYLFVNFVIVILAIVI